ncbi:hypothetical protein VTL71DRAFT_9951 [Oculimacula yallundae]|uniref:Uncharacterized protein n=1 Tax=Oculimacula yallundae TaxID=86028 RepID=A0ABR4BR12_9HELO
MNQFTRFFNFKNESSTFSKEDPDQQPFLEDNVELITSKNFKRSPTLYARYGYLVVSTTLFIFGMIAISFTVSNTSITRKQQTSSSVVPDQILECGRSAEEAHARGCVFDIMNYAWIPAPCYNKTLSDQYWEGLVENGIEFWKDSSKSEVLPYQEILAARHEYSYTSWLLHLKHCQYLIHRQLQCLTFGTPVDNVSRNLSHAEHCLEEVRRPSDVKTMLFTGTAYLSCAQGVGDIGPIFWNDPPASLAGHRRLLF